MKNKLYSFFAALLLVLFPNLVLARMAMPEYSYYFNFGDIVVSSVGWLPVVGIASYSDRYGLSVVDPSLLLSLILYLIFIVLIIILVYILFSNIKRKNKKQNEN